MGEGIGPPREMLLAVMVLALRSEFLLSLLGGGGGGMVTLSVELSRWMEKLHLLKREADDREGSSRSESTDDASDHVDDAADDILVSGGLGGCRTLLIEGEKSIESFSSKKGFFGHVVFFKLPALVNTETSISLTFRCEHSLRDQPL